METATNGSGSSAGRLAHASRRVRSLAVVLHTLFEALDESRQPIPLHATVRAGLDQTFDGSVNDLVDEIGRAIEEVRRQLRDAPTIADGAAAMPGAAAAASTDVDACAEQLAGRAFEVSLERLIEEHEETWSALVDAVRRQHVPLDGQPLDRDQTMDTYSRLLVALPADSRREFRQFAESTAFQSIVERGAAFELGRHVERRAAGLA